MQKRFFRRHLIRKPMADVYVPNPRGRHVWLQRLAYAVLKRFGTNALMEVEAVKETALPEPDSILDGIRHEIRARVTFSGLRTEDLAILVGLEADRELSLVFAGDANFWVERTDRGRTGREVFGVPVYVTGWLDGWLVLPRKAINPHTCLRSAA